MNDPVVVQTISKKSLSRGTKSLLLLTALGGFAAIGGLFAGNASFKAHNPEIAEAAALPPLAATLLSADDLTPFTSSSINEGQLKSRETLIDLVTRLGAEHGDANRALAGLVENELIDPRRVRPGLEAKTWMEGDTLTALAIKSDNDRRLLATRTSAGDWTTAELKAKLIPTYKNISAVIETSIYDQALKLGARDQQVVDFASIFAYDVDFQREIYPGDKFEMLYESFVDERGNPIRAGKVLYASLNGKAVTKGFYNFTPEDDGVSDYFDENGESATRFLMKTPINGARLSSSFGRRKHPISGYSRLHKGTDFAARSGTPVYAAGNGKIERASRYGGYGNYVRVKHANGYKTAYAHLSRYGPDIKSGRRVRQGDTIGYVGSTGASTGPHLHYEVYIKGKPVNAMRLKLPTGRKLAENPDILPVFKAHRDEIDALRSAYSAPATLASASTIPSKTP